MPTVSSDRRQSRILAMQALCHRAAQGAGVQDALRALAAEVEAEPETYAYARTLCTRYEANHADIDARLSGVLKNWELDRLDDVTRSVLRVATVELLIEEVPAKVAVNEAIEIARAFGDEKAARFVNGVLDPLLNPIAEED